MTERYQKFVQRFIHWADTFDPLHAALVIGSQARHDHVADEYSDIDIVMFVDHPEYFISTDEWVNALGLFHISFVENTMDGCKERRILFEDAMDVDFILRPRNTLDSLSTTEAASILSLGYTILVDKIGLKDMLKKVNTTKQQTSFLTEKDFQNTVNDFWYHTVWSTKKILRGELWTAHYCTNVYMRQQLLYMIEHHTRLTKGLDYCTWHHGRFIEQWSAPWIIEQLPHCFSVCEKEHIKNALFNTMDLFRAISLEIAEKSHFPYPQSVDSYATNWVISALSTSIYTKCF